MVPVTSSTCAAARQTPRPGQRGRASLSSAAESLIKCHWPHRSCSSCRTPLGIFFTKLWLKQKRSPRCPQPRMPFRPLYAVSPRACSTCVLFQDGKMGCSALKTDCVHSSLGITSPAKRRVWITLLLASDDAASAFCPVFQTCVPGGGGRAGPLPAGMPAGSAAATRGTSTALSLRPPRGWCVPLRWRCTGTCGVCCITSPCLLGCSDVPQTQIRSCWWGVKSLVFGWWRRVHVGRDSAEGNM